MHIILVTLLLAGTTALTFGSKVPSLYESFPAINLNPQNGSASEGLTSADAPTLALAEWEAFKVEYKKEYASKAEHDMRKGLFFQNFEAIQTHNADPQYTYKLGVNEFADLSHDELRTRLFGFRNMSRELLQKIHDDADFVFTGEEENLLQPATMDWRTRNAVTPVKTQGQCGGCYSFSATGALEGATAIKTGRLTSLSEQNILDCSGSYGNMGCNGGTQSNAFNYVRANGGINTEASYPFTGTAGACRYNRASIGATCTGYTSVASGNENALMLAVANKGPVAVSIDATSTQFAYYKSGLFNNPSCSKTVDHAVLVVGYGTMSGSPYWLVKNSWGTSWGQAGYIYMARNANNQCGIALWATTPNV